MVDLFDAMFHSDCDSALRFSGTPGAAIALIGDDVEWHLVGRARRRGGSPIGATTVFQAASLSKSLTAWGVMKLVEDGLISLEDQLWPGITIRHLLSHTAGLPRRIESGVPKRRKGAAPIFVTVHRQRVGEFHYTSEGYNIIQEMVEAVTGTPFADFMRVHICEPLGMSRSFFEWLGDSSSMARGYGYLGLPVRMRRFSGAAAGLYTTVEDLARFVRANLTGGSGVLQLQSLGQMHARVSRVVPYGLGFQITTLSSNIRLIWHAGHNRGFRSWMGFLPQSRVGLVVLTNSDLGQAVIAAAVTRWLTRFTRLSPSTKDRLDLVSVSRCERFKRDVKNIHRQ